MFGKKGSLIFFLVVLLCSPPVVDKLFAQGAASFVARRDFGVGVGPTSVAVGDFDGDGIPDLAVANELPNNVAILLGNRDGTFKPAQYFDVGSRPSSIAVGNFDSRNGRTTLDLAVANNGSNDVSILLGNGNGTFQPATSFGAGTGPASIAVEDFDDNGKLDLAVANAGSNNVSILLGNGDGTFQPATNFGAGTGPASIAVGNFDSRNGRTTLDLAVANSGSNDVSILLGNGNGTFQPATSFGAGTGPASIAVGKFRDNKLDLAVANAGSNNVSILLGNGNGTFQPATNFDVGLSPSSIAVGNFDSRNGRTTLDLAVTSKDLSVNTVSILLGNGNGTFQSPQSYYVGLAPSSVIVKDFNDDGKPDLAVANSVSGSVSILLGKGDGTLRSVQSFGVGGNPVSVAVGNFDILNGRTTLDLAVANFGSNDVSILLGNGDGTFQAVPITFGVGVNPVSVAVGDFNGDFIADLAVANSNSNNVSILLGNGDGTFQPATNITVGTQPTSVAVGNFDIRNGRTTLDLAVTNFGLNKVSILIGNGDGTFKPPTNVDVGSGPFSVVVGDFNSDGKLDLAVANENSNNVSILLGNGDGTFQLAGNFGVGNLPKFVAVGNFDSRNGRTTLDLAVTNGGVSGNPDTTVSILIGNGDGTFQPATNLEVGNRPLSVTVEDFNGDGKLDLAVANEYSNTVSILLGNGDGTFQPAQNFGVGSNVSSVPAGDFNGDGKPDLAVTNFISHTVSILINDTPRP